MEKNILIMITVLAILIFPVPVFACSFPDIKNPITTMRSHVVTPSAIGFEFNCPVCNSRILITSSGKKIVSNKISHHGYAY